MKDFSLTGKKILVTGGAGFIGSNLTARLLELGNEVTVLDNFSTGKRENLAPFADLPGFRLIEGDIRELSVCIEAAAGMDFILHEAALGSVPRSIKDPATTTAVNVAGFVNILHAARSAGVRRLVYASSSSVYGDCTDSPKVEERTGTPLSPYALTKSVDELFAANFAAVYGLEAIGLRYFNVFGRRQDPNGAYAAVIPKFSAALIARTSPVINGDGSYSRDFTFVEDVIQANILALQTTSKSAVNTVYNVAGNRETTLNELFAALKKELAAFDPAIAEIRPVYGPVRQGDIPHSLADISKAGKLLGYKPEYTVDQGLALTAKWYFENLR